MTTLPRWTTSPPTAGHPHVAEIDHPLAEGLAAAMTRAAVDLGAPAPVLLLAAHAKVLAVLTGEANVTAGLALGDRLLTCSVEVGGSWRELVAEAARSLAAGSPSVAAVETVAQVDGAAAALPVGLPPSVQLRVTASLGIAPTLRVAYRGESVDDEYARRLAGYHATALAQLAADPDAPLDAAGLVGAREIRHQLERFAGPARDLPPRRVHELVADRAREHPDRVAATQGSREWTYAQLQRRADAAGRHLLGDGAAGLEPESQPGRQAGPQAVLRAGLQAEDVVAVITERNLEWLAAVLAILGAGGAYLPVDPAFPADRIARVLRRAGCRHVLTQGASRGSLDAAVGLLAEGERPRIHDLDRVLAGADDAGVGAGAGEADAAEHAGAETAGTEGGLGVEVGPERLAYLYFTSGSTGEPKGAMCEHAGLLNHVLAKIDDLGIGPGDTVAQTAPQCFDISLWQLLAGLVVGGRTLIVEQEAILDVERFVDTIDAEGVSVLQVVPSYLEAVLTYLETSGRTLPALRCVSVTGEALKAELARRWFETGPATRLVNAYGLTETSDDTNHEVMDEAPVGGRVPLGPPIPNVRVYVVDERLVPVPLGAPGEIVFAGVCVGRGYVNDPERTAGAYLVDPFHPGDRLYRGGDIGRWTPEGKLDFLGRRDHQVKVSGFRIEIGEVEDALVRAPGVRDAAVVVTDLPGRARRLVGFYAADAALPAEELRALMGSRLPSYMVPRTLHHRAALPLTANGKIDRAALLALATALDDPSAGGDAPAGAGSTVPASPTEARIAAAWAGVLGLPVAEIGRRDHFFDRGGTSLAAVKLAIALDRAVTVRDLLAHPVLADLAAVVDDRAGATRRTTARATGGATDRAARPAAAAMAAP